MKVIVIGGGAAGLLAAGVAAEQGNTVTLFEKNEKFARKLGITGKGRCNLTNACDMQTLLANIPTNARFLQSALHRFPPTAVMDFFEGLGVPLKVERGNRVFPTSDRAADIVNALRRFAADAGVTMKRTAPVASLCVADGTICGVKDTRGVVHPADRVILCTGGLSYPGTGSTGDGHRMAKEAGHTIVDCIPSLVPIVTKEKYPARLMGLSLKNVALHVIDTKAEKEVFAEQGELLFTHFGLSGPLSLSASAHMREKPADRYAITIDLKPALSASELDSRLVRELTENANRDLGNILGHLLPSKLISEFAALCGLDLHRKGHSITKEERTRMRELLHALPMTCSGLRPIAEAIVTAGGVAVSEVNPKTMESKLCRGLHFAGEILDVDAYTGGFNLQIAFATAHAAATACVPE